MPRRFSSQAMDSTASRVWRTLSQTAELPSSFSPGRQGHICSDKWQGQLTGIHGNSPLKIHIMATRRRVTLSCKAGNIRPLSSGKSNHTVEKAHFNQQIVGSANTIIPRQSQKASQGTVPYNVSMPRASKASRLASVSARSVNAPSSNRSTFSPSFSISLA